MHVLNPVLKVDTQFLDAVAKHRPNTGKKALRAEIVEYLKQLDLPP